MDTYFHHILVNVYYKCISILFRKMFLSATGKIMGSEKYYTDFIPDSKWKLIKTSSLCQIRKIQ